MEQRWLMLKSIHHQIVTGSDGNIIDDKELKQISSILKVLLSLEILSCEKFPSRCLHCHQLLALTVIKLIFETRENYSEHLSGLDSVLVTSLFSCDKFVGYSTQKTLLAWLKSTHSDEKQKFELLDNLIVRKMINSDTTQTVLQLLTHVMSRKYGEQLNNTCFKVLQKHLPEIFQSAKTHPKHLYNFYALLQKLTKFIHRQPNDIELLQQIFGDTFEELVETVFSGDVKDDCKLVKRKQLDLLNSLICYSDKLSIQKQVHLFYINFSLKYMQQLSEKGFCFKFETFEVGFMGHEITDSQLDISLFRRMILLSFKMFAVLVKDDQLENSGDVSCIIERCIKSIKSSLKLPGENICDLEWLPLVFDDQDDAYIECLLCLLDISSAFNKRDACSNISTVFNPYPLFFIFMETTDYDSSVAMDWLVSPETCFLVYISRLLKRFVNEWQTVVKSAHTRYSEDCVGLNLQAVFVSRDVKDNILEFEMGTGNESNMKEKHVNLISVTSSIDRMESLELRSDQNNHIAVPEEMVCSSQTIQCPSEDSVTISTLSSGLSAIMTYSDSDEGSDSTHNQSNLDYLIDFHPNQNITNFNKSCGMQCLDRIMSLFIRVRIQIERLVDQDLFPYNPAPLLSLITQCENLYEN